MGWATGWKTKHYDKICQYHEIVLSRMVNDCLSIPLLNQMVVKWDSFYGVSVMLLVGLGLLQAWPFDNPSEDDWLWLIFPNSQDEPLALIYRLEFHVWSWQTNPKFLLWKTASSYGLGFRKRPNPSFWQYLFPMQWSNLLNPTSRPDQPHNVPDVVR